MSARIEHHEVSLDEILDDYADGLEVPVGHRIIRHHTTVDSFARRVIFSLYIESTPLPEHDATQDS